MTDRFNRAYDALVSAYFNGVLAAGSCVACGVGTICAAALGISHEEIKPYMADSIYGRKLPGNIQSIVNAWTAPITRLRDSENWDSYKEEYDELELLTGYNVQEINMIERTFESNTYIKAKYYTLSHEQDILEDQFRGLSAVVDLLLSLDSIEDPDGIYNNKFKQHPKLQTA